MATISWWTRDGRGVCPAPASGLVGRSRRCDLALGDADVPHFWLEIRWRGDRWAWRPLTDDGRTRATGSRLDDGWRELSGRVSCGTHVGIELVDGAPPEPFVIDLVSGHSLRGSALDAVLEIRADAVLPADWEASGDLRPLRDGDVVVLDGRAWRVALPGPVTPTDGTALDLGSPHLQLDVDCAALTATFTEGRTQAAVHGEPVRVLAAYAIARVELDAFGGWLTATEAFDRWVALGGNPQSPRERVGWLKGKLRAELSTRRAGNLAALFENRREGGSASRIALSPERIAVQT